MKIEKVNNEGKITIPKEIRKILDIKKDDFLKIKINSSNQIIIEKHTTRLDGRYSKCACCDNFVYHPQEKNKVEGIVYYPIYKNGEYYCLRCYQELIINCFKDKKQCSTTTISLQT